MTPLTRTVALAVIAAAVLDCSRPTAPQQRPDLAPAAPYQRTILDRTKPTRMAVDVPLGEGRKIVEAAYRVRPDRRFVNAAADVVEIAGGERQEQTEIDYAEGSWWISVAGAQAFRIPELATFDAALTELTRWASKQPRRGETATTAVVPAEVDADLERFRSQHVFSALKRLGVAAGGRPLDAAGMQRAARAAILLSIQAEDPFDISDTLDARALGLLATARSLDPRCCREEEALLAWAYGYVTEAKKLAAELPAGSIDGEAWQWLRSRHEPDEDAPADFPSLLREHEKAMEGAVKRDTTPFVDDRSIRSFLEAGWYSRLHRHFVYLHDEMGLPDQIAELAESLKPRSATGAQVVAWMAQTSSAHYGRLHGMKVSQSVRAATLLGGRSKFRLFESISRGLGVTHPGVRASARELYMVVDSRPEETWVASRLSDPIGHVRNHRVYLNSSLDRAPQEHGDFAAALFAAGEGEPLYALARDRKAAVHDRMNALYYLAAAGDGSLHKDFEDAISDAAYDPAHLTIYLDYLDNRNEARIKEKFVRLVLARNPDLDPIYKANIVSFLVDALARQGRYEEAWRTAEPHVPVFSAYILSEAVPVLERLGRSEEALRLGQQMIKRYPSADMIGDYAIVLWRLGRHADAAALFAPDQNASALETFVQHVPKKFVEAFAEGEKAETEALRAYEEFIKLPLPAEMLSRFASAALQAERWKLALALEERFQKIPYAGNDRGQQLSSLTTGYKAVRELQNEEAASQWFIDRTPSGSEFHQMMALLNNHDTDLIVALAVARPPAGADLGRAGVIAAALAIDKAAPRDPRWNIVRALLPLTPPETGDDRATFAGIRHLLGDIDAAAVAETDPTTKGRTLAAFFIGTAAAAAGRDDDALRDLLVASDGPAFYAPTSWATSYLYIWRAQRQHGRKQSGS